MNLIDATGAPLFISGMSRLGIHIETSAVTHPAPGGHPENCHRLRLVADELQSRLRDGRLLGLSVTEHDLAHIHRVHSIRHLKLLQDVSRSGGGYLDPDTYVASDSWQAAVHVVDIALSAIDAVMDANPDSAFLLVRPPGHHAEHDHAMGFCLLNNIATAAQYLVDKYRLQRIAIVDFDVHHGNGTQHLFYDRSDVYFISTHQYPFYPGTGAADETGTGAGKGFTLNIPMSHGDGDAAMLAAFEQEVVPALHRYRPEFVLVSAGFDAHKADPLGGLTVTGTGYRKIGRMLADVARQHAGGRLVSVLEGGYDAEGNLDAITHYIDGTTEL